MKQNQVRVIAGKWRGRKITFPNIEILRPTPDRIRETLFNWLSPHIREARCLDLFAGSGVLGFEALSRGANHVVCLENNLEVIAALRKNVTLLKTESLEIIEEDAISWLKGAGNFFDIVFLDPPYQSNVLPIVFSLLEKQRWLHPNSLVYFESNDTLPQNALPNTWRLLQAKKAGLVYYSLAQKLT